MTDDHDPAARTGPFEDRPWPERLRARAVQPGPKPRLHGYAVHSDLAQHYRLAEVMLIALSGETQSAAAGEAFGRALIFASACPVNEAPTHAAVLARSIGAPASSALASGTTVATEAARARVAARGDTIEWLRQGAGSPPPDAECNHDEQEHGWVARLRLALQPIDDGDFAPPPTLCPDAALLYVLWRCGVQTSAGLVAALSWAMAISIAAETTAPAVANLMQHAAHVPPFRYEPPR